MECKRSVYGGPSNRKGAYAPHEINCSCMRDSITAFGSSAAMAHLLNPNNGNWPYELLCKRVRALNTQFLVFYARKGLSTEIIGHIEAI
jgi:hypothetical protein